MKAANVIAHKVISMVPFDIRRRPEVHEVLGRKVVVSPGSIRAKADKDDAWFLACAKHAKKVFDVGANVGYSAMLAALAGVEEVVLVEPKWLRTIDECDLITP